MKHLPLLNVLEDFEQYQKLSKLIRKKEGAISVFGLSAPHRAHITARLSADFATSILYVLPTEADCALFENQLAAYDIATTHFPVRSEPISTQSYVAAGGTEKKRLEFLCGAGRHEHEVILISTETLMQRLAPPQYMRDSIFKISVGETYSIQALAKRLVNAGYEHTQICESSGTFCVRGGRIDIFPINSEVPVRIEFFDDEVDTMRFFDPATQRGTENTKTCIVYPTTEIPVTDEIIPAMLKRMKKFPSLSELISEVESGETINLMSQLMPLVYGDCATILDYMAEGTIIIADEPGRLSESANNAYNLYTLNVEAALAELPGHSYLARLYLEPSFALHMLDTNRSILFFTFATSFSHVRPKEIIQFDAQTIPQYSTNSDVLFADIRQKLRDRVTLLIYAGDKGEMLYTTLQDISDRIGLTKKLERDIVSGEALVICDTLYQGFEYREQKLCVISESELFSRTTKKKSSQTTVHKKPKSALERLTVSTLATGDFVVHEKHGIGRYLGIKQLVHDGVKRDYLNIQYSGESTLYIPCDKIDTLHKYVGTEGIQPKLSKLGGIEWQKTVTRVRSSVKALAFDLVRLYGERMNRTGYAYSPDTEWQKGLESAFPYEETPDQLTCISEIKKDMESTHIMDRLLCGDVGFGKTEVALRAAFKAVMDSKQVAFLVPTTVLAHQHYNTLRSRFSGYPVEIECLSRFRTKAEQKQILGRVADGRCDILIGTHRILSKDVKFHDLGLLIIDEEQRFGVGHKEIIKEMKKSVDVLTLTATPIPRTLHMSLIGLRDVSLIETPPSQRYPVQTFVTEYNETLVREAIMKEIGRGGQVYFLFNAVQKMESFYSDLCKLVPEATIRYAHGQMNEHRLEQTMLDFLEGNFDVLLSSTIIENGLDVPNANTIIIYDADRLGLSQLYQLRGRVGRSTRLGYAYLTFQKNKVFTEETQKRLLAIKEFTQLGTGYRLAMRDLQIRGAGDVLGPEQHGHMEDVGYEMYRKMMHEAISQAKGSGARDEEEKLSFDTRIELKTDAYIPPYYIENDEWRLAAYKRIASILTDDDKMDVEDELIDRYGDIPQCVLTLIEVASVKAKAHECFITNICYTDPALVLSFADKAPYDLTALFETVKEMKNASLSNLNGVSCLNIKLKQHSPEQLLAKLPTIFAMLAKCLPRLCEKDKSTKPQDSEKRSKA